MFGLTKKELLSHAANELGEGGAFLSFEGKTGVTGMPHIFDGIDRLGIVKRNERAYTFNVGAFDDGKNDIDEARIALGIRNRHTVTKSLSAATKICESRFVMMRTTTIPIAKRFSMNIPM